MNRFLNNRNEVTRRSSVRSLDALSSIIIVTIISCIIVLLPPALPFKTSPGQTENTTAASILMVAAAISLLTTASVPRRLLLTTIAILLAVLSLYLASAVATYQQRQWGISGVPVIFILEAFFITIPRRKTPLQRIAGIGAALLFLGILYAISITHLWWQFILICIFTYILCFLLLRHLIPFFHMRVQIYHQMSSIVTFAIIIALILGFFNAAHFSQHFAALLPETNATLTITLLAIFISQRLCTHTCIMLWSNATILLVLMILPFQIDTLPTFLLAALAILLALTAIWLGRISLTSAL